MYTEEIDGLGKFKLKKIKKALMRHPLAPLPVKAMAMKKVFQKKKPAETATPAPAVEPTYQQEPLPSPAPQPAQPPIYYPQPVQPPVYYPQPVQPPVYRQPVQPPVYEESPREIPEDYFTESQPKEWYPPSNVSDDAGASFAPIVTAPEFESWDMSEESYLEGLSEGTSWGDIFTGAAAEYLAQQRAKREAKESARRQAEMARFQQQQPQGFALQKYIVPAALALGAALWLAQGSKKRG